MADDCFYFLLFSKKNVLLPIVVCLATWKKALSLHTLNFDDDAQMMMICIYTHKQNLTTKYEFIRYNKIYMQ